MAIEPENYSQHFSEVVEQFMATLSFKGQNQNVFMCQMLMLKRLKVLIKCKRRYERWQ